MEVNASDELGGVGRPPGAFKLAWRRLVLSGSLALDGLRGVEEDGLKDARAAVVALWE